jgi:hypothetical protein
LNELTFSEYDSVLKSHQWWIFLTKDSGLQQKSPLHPILITSRMDDTRGLSDQQKTDRPKQFGLKTA